MRNIPLIIRNKYFFSIIIIISLGICQQVYANIHFRNLGKADGLSQLSIMSICQDELGRMWFGTLEGINCYDGEHITAFKSSAEYPMLGNETFNVVSNKQGSIFFTSDSMLIHYDIYKEKFSQIRRNGTRTLTSHGNQIWMATRDSIFKWNAEKQLFTPVYSQPKVIKGIRALSIDHQGRLCIGTSNGLYRIDFSQKNPTPVCLLPQINIGKIYEDSHQNLWAAGHRNGMYKITPEGTTKFVAGEENSLSNNDVRDFIEDNSGNLWISTFYGLNKLDRQGNFTFYTKDILPGSLTHSSIYALYKDIQGTIWAGTFYGGVQYFNPEADLFTHYSENTSRNDCLNFFFVGKMAEDKRGDIWICTEGGGLNKLDRKTERFTYYVADGKPNSIPFNNLKCITYDEKLDRLYIGTHTKGLFCLDIQTGKVKNYQGSTLSESSILHVALYKDQLFFLTNKGLFKMDLITETITNILSDNKITDEITFTVDAKGWVWVAERSLLQHINLQNPHESHSYRYGEKGLGKFPITRIIEDKSGNIYLATCGSGLFRYDQAQDRFIGYSVEQGSLPSNYCYDIASSNLGHLIVSNEQGITFFYPNQEATKTIDLKDKLYLSALNEGCGLLISRNGEIFVGGTNGMTSFMENKLFNSPPSYDLYFSSLLVNDQLVHPDASDILSKALPFSQRIDLKHNQNNIIINYTSNNYIGNLHKDVYEYRLEGFDNRWITNTDRKIVYTNLNPGNYTLVVREKNANGRAQFIQLQIVVHSPWYATWLAYVSYVLILSGLAFIFLRDRYTRMQLRLSLEEEKREKEKNEEIIQAKLQFFSNISHEFRTPLTLINSQIEMLLQYKGLPSLLHQRLQRIYRNTFQLRELISELLDFRKMERGGMRLKISHMNLIPFLQGIHQEFLEQASIQNINLKFTSATEQLMCWYDAKQLKRILLNLLSNAFKYTPEGGEIVLSVEEKENDIEMKVTDTGQGISQEALPHIFERFYQSDNSSTKEPGTGIGLALTKGLVELHHGTINALSAPGYGSVFTVCLPKDNVFSEDSYVTLIDSSEQPLPNAMEDVTAPIQNQQESILSLPDEEDTKDKPCILIVEDNEDLLQMLADLLTPLYKVVIALNGQDGLKKAQEETPDLILSDIMMPLMMGTEMCREIKNSFDLCHIPVILLTALTSEEKNIEGLQCGADDYIGKPFSNKLLIGKIANMLRNRSILKTKYSQLLQENASNHRMEGLIMNDIDKRFMTQLSQSIEKHMSNPDFDINLLAKEIGVSRTSLYNKLRALSSMTPNEFILQSRLKRSAELLREHPEMQVTEIAYQVGFSTLRYFRSCFKAQFGEAPQEYKNKHVS